ncbi:MAG: LLM class flavin-dependent oxidoreductase [Acidimicrobiia bacterium]|nr:LLM class flavin-dependent oxidoreductase [Acidimicrobiia bacterium]
MHIGIQLPEVERIVPWPEYRAMAILAEEVGFDSLWLGDHLLYDKPEGALGPWECWTQLAAIAAVTNRVLLGPLVSPTGWRNPALLVKMAAAVDEISGGRLVLGLGSGWNRREFDAYGYAFEKRVSRFEEAFTIITSLIRTGHADVSGEFYQIRDLPMVPPTRSDLPIMIGSTGPRMLSITAPHLNWWNEWWSRFDNHPAGLDPLLERLDSALGTAGRERAEITTSVAISVALPAGGGRVMGADVQVPPITGTAQEIAEQIAAFSAKVDHVQIVLDPITMESIEMMGTILRLVRAG